MSIKHILLASAVLVSVSSFAQKDELKKLKKIYDKETPTTSDLTEYKANLEKLASLATEEGDKVYYNYYKVNTPSIEIALLGAPPTAAQLSKYYTPKSIVEMATVYNATLEYEKKAGKKVFTDDINQDITAMKPILVNVGFSLAEAKKYQETSDVMYAIYLLDKKDQDNLFYAASYSVYAQDFAKALNYYNELKTLNYTGEKTNYLAMNKETKKEDTFTTANERELFIKAGTHEKPRNEKTESKRGEIYKNIALILIESGKVEEAKAAITEARKNSPNDNSLLLTEADVYLKLNDLPTYQRLINEALAKDPNNAVLYFNLGVTSSNSGKLEEADKYYLKAIELNPKYYDALLNIAELKSRSDEKIVTEMNKLGTSDKDNKRYEVLKAEREKNFKAMIPYLERAVEADSTGAGAKELLLSVYHALEMTDKYKELKAKM